MHFDLTSSSLENQQHTVDRAQPVAPKTRMNRLHFDVVATHTDLNEESLSLPGRKPPRHGQGGVGRVMLADPDGKRVLWAEFPVTRIA